MAKSKEAKKIRREWTCVHCGDVIFWNGYDQTWLHVENCEAECTTATAAPLLDPGEVFEDE